MSNPDAYRKIENSSAGAGAPSAYEQPTSDLGGGGGSGAAVLLESGADGEKISALTAAGALSGTEKVPIVQSGVTVQTTSQDIADLGGGGGGSLPITVGIVPHAAGGQANATQLNYGYNGIATPFSSGDSVQLPNAIAGSVVFIFCQDQNAGSPLAVYAKNGTGDTINGQVNGGQNDFAILVASSNGQFLWIGVCKVDGAWWTNGIAD